MRAIAEPRTFTQYRAATTGGIRVTQALGHRRKGSCAAIAALVLLASGLGGCHRQVKEAQAQAAAPTAPRPHIIVLPDSAIAVQKGSPEEQLADFLASPAPPPRTFRFEGTEFEPWSAKPNAPTERTMYVMTQVLRAYPKSRVTLVGYTDNEGTAEQNLVLARQRVDRLSEILAHGGVRASRIETIGKGAVDFIGDNNTLEGRARNRRIELTVTAK
jgi:outer membrane protein OmpA-like peptidoglycan-associated protein